MTITSKPVRGSWPFEACAAVVGAEEVVPVVALAVLGEEELAGVVLGVELPLEPVLPLLPLFPVLPLDPEWPLEPELPPWPASGSWYWLSPALCASADAGSASATRASTRAKERLRSIRYL
ncbi:MAG: hypothetical protein QOC77_3371 [Thermoleophilaceae bacterium]|nr:hypothetical protein [Thermoleophilaceae bacterium]MEA2469870.1 hypothetical protein [Thermoleophilaceae bacterium]